MHEIPRKLPAGARVLDLGSHDGSFGPECCPGAFIIRLDKEFPLFASAESFVQADAARLPFRDCAFDAVVANHVLEEIGRIINSHGRLYVAAPDASTLSDRIYRWIYHGSGHINAFRRADALAHQITQATRLPLVSFGDIREQVETAASPNVCVHCGAGHSAASLICNHKVFRKCLLWKLYRCPNCGATNLFSEDIRLTV